MVRLKHRYLLCDILYPEPSSWPSTPDIPHLNALKSTTQPSSQLRIHAPTSDALTPSMLARMVREEVADLYGDWGMGKLGGSGAGGVSVKYLSPATSTAIIRCPRSSYRLIWTALTYMTRVPDTTKTPKRSDVPLTRPCVFRVVRVSGTMRKAEEEAIRRARREIVRARGADEEGVLESLVGRVGSVEPDPDDNSYDDDDDGNMDVDGDEEVESEDD